MPPAAGVALAAPPAPTKVGGTRLLHQILSARAIAPVFQPVVRLEDGEVVGYEALARGPEGRLHTPGALFGAAAAAGLTADLDWACIGAALRAALARGLGTRRALFVNIEPASMAVAPPLWVLDLIEASENRLRVIAEVTERRILDRPADLLDFLDRVRDRHWGVAIDDLGAEHGSLAMLPFVAPDVVKLDLRVVQGRAHAEAGGIISAARAHAERTGATILAEGIETEAHLDAARVAGATLGQGWLLGRPGPLDPPRGRRRAGCPSSRRHHRSSTAPASMR